MRINFFEEYPTDENMSKLGFIDWSSTVFIASSSLDEFYKISKKYSKKYPHITFGWWPVIPGSYWVSALINPFDLDKIFKELTTKRHREELLVLLDFELPIKKSVIFKNLVNLRNNKKTINRFIGAAKQHNVKIYSAEYPSTDRCMNFLWRFLGLSPSSAIDHTKIKMCYSSMKPKLFGDFLWGRVRKYEKYFSKKHPGINSLGLGVTATGVLGDENIISPNDLKSDIDWAKKCDISEIFIFRLGGFSESYLSILKQ